ncbi:MAG: tRNA 2-selenouridine(34) synthase MnmH [Bacteroidales bacterium]|nr:tRNA 2-selenouridine(34) synthase MnmH [Bacteroidales bacterium]MBK8882618.1 tRNA 2-selenouridine(34) synthase MnmH [Bacteroidales bacterium]
MIPEKIQIEEFLELAERIPVIDVRSPSEYCSGHIPGAINIPLFNDTEREAVGIRYKKEGRFPAILEGLKLSGPLMSEKLSNAMAAARDGKLLVHCWRGGMRSESMAWLFSLGEIRPEVLEGGYKAYRNYILGKLSERNKMIVLGGLTGSSKTYILRFLKSKGHQIVDLEGLANHKGSAFGALGELPQPLTEQFANNLYDEWRQNDSSLPFWVEDESRNIGTVFIPDCFYENMQKSPSIILLMEVKHRLPRLIREYSTYPQESLKASVLRISKRLGGDNTRDAINAVEQGDYSKAIEITLKYYDKAYQYGLKKKESRNIIFVETDTDDIETNAMKILDASSKITW